MRHTPGRWSIRFGDDEASDGFTIGSPFRANIAEWWPPSATARERAEARANARLIAAAPDLLEACRLALAAWGDKKMVNGHEYEALKALRAALSRAE